MKPLALVVLSLLPGCALLRPPEIYCPNPEPPIELVRVPPSLPPLPIDLPISRRD